MKAPAFARTPSSECDYVPLTPGEIKKLKDNGIEPHDLKRRGSREDLFKCKPSGKVVVRRKTRHLDERTGEWSYPPAGESEDTGINIDDLPWKQDDEFPDV